MGILFESDYFLLYNVECLKSNLYILKMSCYDGLDTLPSEIVRNFALMKKLDQQSENYAEELEEKIEQCKRVMDDPERDNDKYYELLASIANIFQAKKDLAESKINIAKQVYESVDKQVRQLDNSLDISETRKKRTDDNVLKITNSKKKKVRNNTNTAESIKKSRKKRKMNEESLVQQPYVEQSPFVSSIGPDVMDMPVDPNEPTYCVCRQVSFGQMVMCDNSECPIEWFHFGCVGLEA